ncbi:MAG: VOC family protein [Cyclobacteriaceae bacterium]
MTSIRSIKEVCLYVKDLDQTELFYRDQLGFEVISKKNDRHIFFRVGDQVLLCFIPEVTKADTKLPPHYASGPQHIAFEVSKQDYKPMLEKLLAQGVPIIHEEHWRGDLYSAYFKDPDDHVLEIVVEGLWDY